jgi:hypothetical protein
VVKHPRLSMPDFDGLYILMDFNSTVQLSPTVRLAFRKPMEIKTFNSPFSESFYCMYNI